VEHPYPFGCRSLQLSERAHDGCVLRGHLLADGDDLAPLYFAVAAVVAASRIHVGIHHASDVLAGVVVGLALGQLGKAIAPLPNLP